MMNENWVLVLDVDGTLLDAQERIHAQDMEILQRGVPCVDLVLNTGRPLYSLQRCFARNGLFADGLLPLAVVERNGAGVFAARLQELHQAVFPVEIQKTVIRRIQEHPTVTLLLQSSRTEVAVQITPYGARQAARFDFEPQIWNGADDLPLVGKIMCISEDLEALKQIYAEMEALPVERSTSMAGIVEIGPGGVNKARGYQKLAEQLGWQDRAWAAAGDGGNDLAMLRLAKRSFAPLSAPERVRLAAGSVIDRQKNGLLRPLLSELGLREES